MPIALNELSPQLARLFHAAGLLDAAEWEAYISRHQKHKSILDVLTQQVSLDTFRDLLFAEVSLKSNRWPQGGDSGLHQGLTTGGTVNEEELRHLVGAYRPAATSLLQPLTDLGMLDAETAQRTIESYDAKTGEAGEWIFGEGLLSAQVVCKWLSWREAPHLRLAALYLALELLRGNDLMTEKDLAGCLKRLTTKELAGLLTHVKGDLGVTSKWIVEKLETHLTLPQIAPGAIEVDSDLLARFPQSFIRRHTIIPFEPTDGRLAVATSDPLNIPLTAFLAWITGSWPRMLYTPGGLLIERINGLYSRRDGQGATAAAEAPVTAPTAAPTEDGARGERRESDIVVDNMSAVQLVSSIIESAIEMQATDIHIEPARQGLLIRYRIDGELHRVMTIPTSLVQSVISRVKVLADMDVTERRRPQDGHFELKVETHNYDFRISTLPAVQGEKVVIRILDETRVQTGLDGLGLLPAQQRLLEGMLHQPYGLILVTGPTGSGKTSTLYAAMNLLNRENRNLVTIEDPVEYQVEGINQVQVDPHIGLTFSEGLRSVLRQDPDVIMVGEIRDGDTAHNAIRAAMTGHLVFSTLHTNTAIGAIDALVHLGSAPFMVAGSLIGILSQRLLRKLCVACRAPQKTNPAINQQLGLEETLRKRIFKPVGCGECFKSGYQGRSGVFEVIRVGELLRPLITQRKLTELEQMVREQRMMSLAEAAAQKVLEGITSVEEAVRKVILD